MHSGSGAAIHRRQAILGDTPLGEFSLPLPEDDGHGQPHSPEVRATARLTAAPQRAAWEGNHFYLVWTESVEGAERLGFWSPETTQEAAEAERFYQAAHGGSPPVAGRPRAGGWLRWLTSWLAAPAMSEQDKPLIRQVLDAPALDAPRLAYAQRLMERGDPQGEFILAAIVLEALPPDDPRRTFLDNRWSDLYEEHGSRWVQPLGRLGLRPEMAGQLLPLLWIQRGLVTRVEIMKPGVLPEKADRLFAAAPLVHDLRLKYTGVDIVGIAAVPQMRQITRLELESVRTTPDDLETILSAHHFGRITQWEIGSIGLDADGASAIAQSPGLARIRSLGVGALRMGDEGAIMLAQSPHWRDIEDLDLRYNELGPAGFQALAASPGLAGLRRLDLSGNRPGAEGVASLVKAPLLNTLRDLDLSRNELGNSGAVALAGSPGHARIGKLCLNGNEIGTAGVQALAASPVLQELTELEMSDNPLDDSAATALANSPYLARLKRLSLSAESVTDAGKAELITRFGDDVVSLG